MTNSDIEADGDGSNGPGGLVAIILVLALAFLGGGYLLWIESPIWVGGFVIDKFEGALASSSIDESEQSELVEVANKLAERVHGRKIGWIDMFEIVQSISESEFAPIAFSLYLQSSAVHPLKLSDEERARTHQTILRLEWAVQNNSIPEDRLDPLWEIVGSASKASNFKWQGKDLVLTEENLNEFLVATEALLAEYEIPLQPYQFDLSESLNEALQPHLTAD